MNSKEDARPGGAGAGSDKLRHTDDIIPNGASEVPQPDRLTGLDPENSSACLGGNTRPHILVDEFAAEHRAIIPDGTPAGCGLGVEAGYRVGYEGADIARWYARRLSELPARSTRERAHRIGRSWEVGDADLSVVAQHFQLTPTAPDAA
jgi:hypothetical protein